MDDAEEEQEKEEPETTIPEPSENPSEQRDDGVQPAGTEEARGDTILSEGRGGLPGGSCKRNWGSGTQCQC